MPGPRADWHGLIGRRLFWAATVALATLLPARPATAEVAFSGFAGVLTDNPWEDIVLFPWRTRVQRPGLVGVSVAFPVGRPIETRLGRLGFEIEAQLVRHGGLQRHWEVNLPVTARLTPPRRILGLFDSVAFGIGPSHATRPPAFEAFRGAGNVRRNLIYWQAELERHLETGPSGRRAALFLRLHHRSDGFGAIGRGGSSNGIVIGYRQRH